MNIIINEVELGDSIINVAKKYTDLEEIQSNSKWIDLRTDDISNRAEEFQEIIQKQGLGNGEAYCMAAARYFYDKGHETAGLGDNSEFLKIKKLLNNSVISSFDNLNKEGYITNSPVPGAIFFMRRRDDSSRGHAGIVTFADDDKLETIEGNTSIPKTKRRHHGDGVVRKERNGDLTNSSSNLYLIGYLNPVQFSTQIGANSLNKKNSNEIDPKKLALMYRNNAELDNDIMQYIPAWLKKGLEKNESVLPDYQSIKENRFLI